MDVRDQTNSSISHLSMWIVHTSSIMLHTNCPGCIFRQEFPCQLRKILQASHPRQSREKDSFRLLDRWNEHVNRNPERREAKEEIQHDEDLYQQYPHSNLQKVRHL